MWPPEYDGTYKPMLKSKDFDKHQELLFGKKKQEPNFDLNMRIDPDLVPHNVDPRYRNPLREKLERREMLLRRRKIDIPEFHVGSIMSVKIADESSPTKEHYFMGICIIRFNEGLWSRFTLRNVIDDTPVEFEYELYNPKMHEIKVLLLEKRLDENLLYLRDAPLNYSRFSFTMSPIPHPAGAPVPINDTKVKLLPRPWIVEWSMHGYRGIDAESMLSQTPVHKFKNLEDKLQPERRYDLMKMYRERPTLKDRMDVANDIQKMQMEEEKKAILEDQEQPVARRG